MPKVKGALTALPKVFWQRYQRRFDSITKGDLIKMLYQY
jgi:hypothetical protein